MVEEKLGGEGKLGCKQNRLNNQMEIKEDFNTWRATNIDKIRDAVREFPPEMKHISSSVSPKRLIGFLSDMAKEPEVEVGKGVAVAAEEKGGKSQGFFASMKAVISKLVGRAGKDGVTSEEVAPSVSQAQSIPQAVEVGTPSVKDVAQSALGELSGCDLSALRGMSSASVVGAQSPTNANARGPSQSSAARGG